VFEITPTGWTAIALTLRIAVVATLVATPLGIGVAWLLSRKNFPGKIFLEALVHLPLVLPPVVTGYLLLLTFGRHGAVGGFLAEFGIVLAFRWTGAALACGVMGFPLLVRPIRISFEAVDLRLEQAATTLGASPLNVFSSVTFPLALPVLRQGARRIRRDHHLRFEHSGRDANHLVGDLRPDPDPERRLRRATADRDFAVDRVRGPDCLGMVCPARRASSPR
jgi:ABC-type proline/glycine betaine transport system permease subunit